MSTIERVRSRIFAHFGMEVSEYKPDDQKISVSWPEADGLDQLEIVMECEEEFGVEIPDLAVPDDPTPAQIAAYIDAQAAK